MGYQALLFCSDEKIARVVTQVFAELDFAIEPVLEPFAAVKKLMAQRFDAVVVDCENEQNASLIFKSARNSSSNQASLAIALVEGQAGVAKAYRIGANLVLTKPINVEQAKGTLRVARGLLRKNSDPTSPAPSAPSTLAKPVPPPPAQSESHYTAPNRIDTLPDPEPDNFEKPELEVAHAALPAPGLAPSVSASMTSSALIEDKLAFAPSAAQSKPASTATTTFDETGTEAAQANISVKTAAASITNSSAVISPASSSTTGSAAAPAPAREASAAPVKEISSKPDIAEEPTVKSGPQIAAPSFSSLTTGAPSFGGLSDTQDEQDSGGSGGSKKIFIAAIVIIAVAALGYFAYGKFGKASPTQVSEAAMTTHQPSQPAMPQPSPAPSTSSALAADTANAPAAQHQVTAQPSASSSISSASPAPIIRFDTNAAPASGPKKLDVTPIHVKSNTTAPTKAQASADESAPILSASSAPDDKNLSGIVSSATAAQPTLAMLKVSQGVSQGLLIKRVQPKYPPAALAVRAQGAVQIEATITRDGSVSNAKVLSGDPMLARAALDAVRQWRYKPYYLDGQPVEIQTQITVNFKAD